MTVPVYRFDEIRRSSDGNTISCRYVVTEDKPFFSGHFPGNPIMPAVSQIEMLRAVMQLQPDWNSVIAGGAGLKFTGLVQPGDTLAIRIHRTRSSEIRFSIEKDATMVSKGTLSLAGGSNA
ncbi:MAG: hypothetical protein LJE91_05555 [Gammaproteobacteria bacterium]|jgi:3-hydroxyacyl-[acyl-carrier-protein] dehydratase|nr:hypothetical protein [Gammaproteobacteria bacterium]